MGWRTAILALAVAPIAAACAMERASPMRLGGTGTATDPCVIEMDGQRFDLTDVAAIARRVRDGVELTASPTTPYRCIGTLVFELQRARVERIGFSPESPLNR